MGSDVKSTDAFLAYVESVRSTPFRWGDHDCVTFANSAVRAYRDSGFMDDWLGNYSTEKGAAIHCSRLLHLYGFASIIDAVDSRLERLDVKYPPRASVVARPCVSYLGHAFGVVVSDRAAFVGRKGLEMLKIESTDVFWRV